MTIGSALKVSGMINAICEEELEDLDSNAKVDDEYAKDDKAEHQQMEAECDEFNILTYAEVVEFLGKLQWHAPNLGAREAAPANFDRFLSARFCTLVMLRMLCGSPLVISLFTKK